MTAIVPVEKLSDDSQYTEILLEKLPSITVVLNEVIENKEIVNGLNKVYYSLITPIKSQELTFYLDSMIEDGDTYVNGTFQPKLCTNVTTYNALYEKQVNEEIQKLINRKQNIREIQQQLPYYCFKPMHYNNDSTKFTNCARIDGKKYIVASVSGFEQIDLNSKEILIEYIKKIAENVGQNQADNLLKAYSINDVTITVKAN